MDECITLKTAHKAHLFSKAKLLALARQSASQRASKILAAHSCELHQWLQGEGQLKYGKFAEFLIVIAAYKYYYFVVETTAKISEGNLSTIFYSELISSTAFSKSSLELGLAIKELRDAAEIHDKSGPEISSHNDMVKVDVVSGSCETVRSAPTTLE